MTTMDDLISRQAAIDALGEKPLAWTESEYEQGLQNQWEQDVDALMALPAAQRWSPVTEPPEEDDNYLCYLTVYGHPKARYRAVCYYDAEDGFCEDGTYTNRVTHWMPLPEPPKEEV